MMVLDSSAIFKLITLSKTSYAYEQATTPLAMYELGNIMFKNSVLHKHYSSKEAIEFLETCKFLLDKMRILIPDVRQAYEISRQYHLSFYDASYMSVVKDLNATFLTNDQKMINKIKPHYKVLLVTDLIGS